jgi:hypothetical protein
MDELNIKTLLQAIRPGTEDERDPLFVEAIEAVRKDPVLASWWEEQKKFDARISEAVAAESPPEGLRKSINRHRDLPGEVDNDPGPNHRRWSTAKRAGVGVIAAAAVVMTALFLLPRQGAVKMESFVDMVAHLNQTKSIRLALLDANPAILREWLAANGAPHDFVLPQGLWDKPSLGCQKFDINGTKAALICFLVGENQIVHLFVMDQSSLANAPGSKPRFEATGGTEMAMWSENGKTYILASTTVSAERLRQLVPS